MRGGVIAHGGLANRGIDNGIDFLTNANCLLGNDLMRAHALHRVVASGHFGDDGVVIVGVEPSAIANLSARFRVEGRVVENDLAGVAGLEFLCALAAFDDGENFAIVRARLAIAFEVRFRQLLVSGIRRLLGCALPGGASTLALLLHRLIEFLLIKDGTEITARIFNEIKRETVGVIELERLPSIVDGPFSRSSWPHPVYLRHKEVYGLVGMVGLQGFVHAVNLRSAITVVDKRVFQVLNISGY